MNDIVVSKKPYFSIILIGLLLFELGDYLSFSYGLSPIIINTLGGIIALYGFIKIPHANVKSLGTAYYILVLLTIVMLFRGSLLGNFLPQYGTNNYDTSFYSIFRHMFFKHHTFAFLMPLVALLPIRYVDLVACKRLGIIVCLISLFLALKHLPDLLLASSWSERALEKGGEVFEIRELTNSFFIGFGLVLLMSYSFQYVRTNLKWLYPITLIAFFLCTIAGAGRGSSLMLLGYVVIFFFIWVKYPILNRNKNFKVFWKKILPIILLVVVILLFYYLFINSFFDFLLERLFDNTYAHSLADSGREGLVKNFIEDFNYQAYPWLVGRGINGAFVSGEGYMRDVIEWGYLYLILKGGIIYLVVYVYIFAKAAYLGLARSRNLLSKALAFICLFRILSLIPFGLPAVSVEFFISWIGVRLLFNKDVRNMDDLEIKSYFGI